MELQLTATHDEEWERDGYTIVRNAFNTAECDEFVDYMLALQAGHLTVEGYRPHGADDWERLVVRNCHNSMSLRWMIDPRLRAPVRHFLGDEPDGIQSMYLFKGSEQRRHQDNYYLPGCISAWVALQRVGPHNGSINIQVGSHKMPQIQKDDFLPDRNGEAGQFHGMSHDDAHDLVFERNNLPEIAVEAEKGDLVFFDGRLIHRGGPIGEPGSFRHSWAGHYIPRSFDPWPYQGLPRLRVSFDGEARFTPVA